MQILKITFTLLFCLSTAAQASEHLATLQADIPDLMKTWEVPGLAMAVIEDGEVVLVQGFGVRERGKKATVDADTIFAIGSITKSFTAACVGLQVSDGKLDWDDPIAEHLPQFILKDPWVTRHATVRDFLSHRSGVAPNNLLFWGTPLSREEVLRRMRFLNVADFRDSFKYNNLGFLAAGQVIPEVSGQSWDDCIRERLFAPLGMERASAANAEFEGEENLATAHFEVDGEVRPISLVDIGNGGPAGSIHASARAMSRWVQVHLGEGRIGDQDLLPADIVREMQRPHNLIHDPGWAAREPEGNIHSYGLGWSVTDYRGEIIIAHGGRTDGMSALLAMMPGKKSGVVILTNASMSLLPPLLAYRLYDAWLGDELGSQDAHFTDLAQNDTMGAPSAPPEHADTRTSLELSAYEGDYHHELYGTVQVRLEGDHLVLEMVDLGFAGDLNHHQYDAFTIDWRTGPQALIGLLISKFHFTLNAQGIVDTVSPGRSKFVRR